MTAPILSAASRAVGPAVPSCDKRFNAERTQQLLKLWRSQASIKREGSSIAGNRYNRDRKQWAIGYGDRYSRARANTGSRKIMRTSAVDLTSSENEKYSPDS